MHRFISTGDKPYGQNLFPNKQGTPPPTFNSLLFKSRGYKIHVPEKVPYYGKEFFPLTASKPRLRLDIVLAD